LQGLRRVSDGTRTRGPRDHNSEPIEPATTGFWTRVQRTDGAPLPRSGAFRPRARATMCAWTTPTSDEFVARLFPVRQPPQIGRTCLLAGLLGDRGETGFEPATARPPAGTIWLPRIGSRGVESLQVGRGCSQLPSLWTPYWTPSEHERDQCPPCCREARGAFAHLLKQADRRRRSHLVHLGRFGP